MWLPLAVNVAAVLGAIALALLEARRIRRRAPDVALEGALRHARYLYVLAAVLVLLVAANLALHLSDDLAWRLPLALQYYYSPVLWSAVIAIVAFTFTLGVALAYATRHAERHKVAVATVLLLGAVEYAQWTYTRPIAPSLTAKVSPDGVVLQSSEVSCCDASAANIARAFGVERTEREMAEVLGSSVVGTSTAQLVYGMERVGIRCAPRQLPDADPAALRLPALLFVDHGATGPESHAVALMAARDGVFEVWDPLIGRRLLSAAELGRRWRGRAVECPRDPPAAP